MEQAIRNPNTNENFLANVRNIGIKRKNEIIIETGEVSQPLSDPQYTRITLKQLCVRAAFWRRTLNLTTNFDMKQKLDNTTQPQHDAKLPVMNSAFTTTEICENINGKVIVKYRRVYGSQEAQKLIDEVPKGTTYFVRHCA